MGPLQGRRYCLLLDQLVDNSWVTADLWENRDPGNELLKTSGHEAKGYLAYAKPPFGEPQVTAVNLLPLAVLFPIDVAHIPVAQELAVHGQPERQRQRFVLSRLG